MDPLPGGVFGFLGSQDLVVWKVSQALFNRSDKRGAEANFLARKGEVN